MSMSLTSLPPELFGIVVADIGSLPTLCNLARCSRQLYFWTRPHLYRHVTIKHHGKQHSEQLQILASSLIRRPDLAELVRTVKMDLAVPWNHKTNHKTKAEDYAAFQNSEDPEERGSSETVNVKTLKTAVNAGSMSKEEVDNRLTRLSQTDKCHYDLILALLLPVLPKVEKLDLALCSGPRTHYFGRMIRRAAGREKPLGVQPPFEALKVFVHSAGYHHRSQSVIASLIKLPAIQKIFANFKMSPYVNHRAFRARDTDKDLIELESSSSSLTSLNLATGELSPEELGHMLRAPKALKTFVYKKCPYASYVNFVDIRFADIRHALDPQKNCLESLELDYSRTYEQDAPNMDYGLSVPISPVPIEPRTSFIGFKNLKVFKVAALFLDLTDNGTKNRSLIDIFPPSLETLHVTRVQTCIRSLVKAIDELLTQKSPRQIPLLKKLVLEKTRSYFLWPTRLVEVRWEGTQETAIGRLSRVAADHGVSIEIIEV